MARNSNSIPGPQAAGDEAGAATLFREAEKHYETSVKVRRGITSKPSEEGTPQKHVGPFLESQGQNLAEKLYQTSVTVRRGNRCTCL